SQFSFYFFFQAEDGIRDFHVTGVQTCALPISTTQPVASVGNSIWQVAGLGDFNGDGKTDVLWHRRLSGESVIWLSGDSKTRQAVDRKSTRLNSSHVKISYAVFCLKKKIKKNRK